MTSRAHRSLRADRLRSSLWAIPSAFVVGVLAVSGATLAVDRHLGRELAEHWWAFGAGADGTRLTLATIAGSTMTVTGVAFSTTVIVLQLASSQYSPRVIRTFRRDRFLQVVLGILCATFVYCLVVLRTITAGDDGPSFTAPVSVTVAMLLGITSLLALVSMVHHVASTVRVTAIIRNIAEETRHAIDRAWPDPVGRAADPCAEPPPLPTEPARASRAPRDGYVDYVDGAALAAIAGARCVRIHVMVGDFVRRDEVLVSVWTDDPAFEGDRLARAIALADERTVAQDVRYGIRLIVDIALRALSPGINDPRTAVECVDQLGALLSHAARRRPPDPWRTSGRVTIHAPRPDLAQLVGLAFDEVITSARASALVHHAVLGAVGAIARAQPRAISAETIDLVCERIEQVLDDVGAFPADRESIARAIRALAGGGDKAPLVDADIPRQEALARRSRSRSETSSMSGSRPL